MIEERGSGVRVLDGGAAGFATAWISTKFSTLAGRFSIRFLLELVSVAVVVGVFVSIMGSIACGFDERSSLKALHVGQSPSSGIL
jgi:hypothetical protein